MNKLEKLYNKLLLLLLVTPLIISCEKEFETHHANFYPTVGDTIIISEKGCVACGIYWELRDDPERVIKLLKTEIIPDNPGYRGGNETKKWFFIATDEGSITLDYWYWRPYEGRSSILKKSHYTVRTR